MPRRGSLSLWLPFWHRLALPLAGLAFSVAIIDASLIGVLPIYTSSVAGIGFLLCVLDQLRDAFHSGPVPCTQVSFEDGAGVLGSKTANVELTWTCAMMRGWRPTMEDSHLATVLNHGSTIGVFAVFDGHGGSEVSAIVPELFLKLLSERLGRLVASTSAGQDLKTILFETVEATDSALLGGPLGVGNLLSLQWLHPFRGVGSTSCIAALDVSSKQIVVANTGDSRAILCRGGEAIALSTDHKPEDTEEFIRISKAGGRVVRTGPCYRIDGGLNLSRALGDYHYKANASLSMADQKIVATPSVVVQSWEVEAEDEFLIVACDGLFERMSRQDVVDHVRSGLADGQVPQQVLRSLLQACCARSPYELGQDNESAILVQWRSSTQQSVQVIAAGEVLAT